MQRIGKNESGSAAIELALVLPVVTMILLGTITFGVAMTNYMIITNAVREAARWAAINSTPANKGSCSLLLAGHAPQDPCQIFYYYVGNNLISLGPTSTKTVSKTIATAQTGDPETIQASFTFSTILIAPTTLTVSNSATMIHE